MSLWTADVGVKKEAVEWTDRGSFTIAVGTKKCISATVTVSNINTVVKSESLSGDGIRPAELYALQFYVVFLKMRRKILFQAGMSSVCEGTEKEKTRNLPLLQRGGVVSLARNSNISAIPEIDIVVLNSFLETSKQS